MDEIKVEIYAFTSLPEFISTYQMKMIFVLLEIDFLLHWTIPSTKMFDFKSEGNELDL